MASFSELKTAVSKRIKDAENTAVSEEDVGDAINASIRFWKQKHFWFNSFTETKTLTIGNAVIPVPSSVTMFRPFRKGGLIIDYQDYHYEVEPVRVQKYDRMRDAQQGMPFIRAYKGGQWLGYYTPDQAYSATWNGLKDYEALEDGSDENDFTLYADRLIMFDACARILVELRADLERAEIFEAGAKGEYENLRSTTENITGTGVLEIETIL